MKSRMPSFLRVFANPRKFRVMIPVKKIVADNKVYEEGVERYKERLVTDGDIGTIIVIKHPSYDLYAVLDGHHRFWACQKAGMEEVACAVVDDYVGLAYFMTKEGYLQPPPLITKYLRVPLKRMTTFLREFFEYPSRFSR